MTSDDVLLTDLGQHRWMVALRGVAAIAFGVLVFAWPGLTLLALVTLWGAYALVDGVLALLAAFRLRPGGRRPHTTFLLIGLLGIAAGVATFLWPGITALALLLIIASWAIVVGVLQIVAAVRLRHAIRGEWLLGVSGALATAFGAMIVANPGAGALALLYVIGGYSIAFGVLLLILALRMRDRRRLVPAPSY